MRTVLDLVRRHQLVTYFALAYGIGAAAFLTYIPNASWLPYAPFWLVGVASPTLAAIAVSWVIGGWPEVGRLLSGFRRWRIGWRWYAAASIFLVGGLALAVAYLLLGNQAPGAEPGMTLGVVVGWLAFTLASGPLAEEAGWRGFALPRMESKSGALGASIVLGVLWAGWHLPQYGLPGNTPLPIVILVPQLIALAIVFTWIYNNTGGSLVATVIAHFGFNFCGAFITGHLGLMPPIWLYIGGSALSVLLVVVVVLVTGPRFLSRRPVADLPIAHGALTPRPPEAAPPARAWPEGRRPASLSPRS